MDLVLLIVVLIVILYVSVDIYRIKKALRLRERREQEQIETLIIGDTEERQEFRDELIGRMVRPRADEEQ